MKDLFASFRSDSPSDQKPPIEHFVGELSLNIGFPTYRFQRHIDLTPLLEEYPIPPFALNLLTNEENLRYIIHLPTPVKEHNADFISEDQQTLQWNQSVKQLLENPVEMSFTAKTPLAINGLSLVVAFLILIGIVFFISFIWFRSKQSHPSLPS